jgi:alkaline phosphatase
MPQSTPRALPFACAVALLAGCASVSTPSLVTAPPRVAVPVIHHPDAETADWWFRDGAAQAAERRAMRGHARNVIVFVGDGMSFPTVAAARILDGQRKGGPGENNRLAWETWPATAFSKTYETDAQTPDSAGTMTAMATGAKTRSGVLGIGQQARRGDCRAANATRLLTLWELAAANGMATGVVTTTRITHATPAATFTHSADRDWEDDADLPASAAADGCIDLARQLVESPFGSGPDVLMGGGRGEFMPATQHDPEYPALSGKRADGRDLIAEWQGRHPGGHYVWNARQLEAAPSSGALLALFEPSHMQFEHDRPADAGGEPSLAQMTRAAITRLAGNRNGYVLLVEGGRIDHASHDGNAYRALTDTIALSEAVAMADAMTSADDTLVLVTADHSHTLTFVGYPGRGNPILGKVRGISGADGRSGSLSRDANGLPYATLAYANGPGYRATAGGRPDLTNVDTADPDFRQESTVPLGSESHGGEDVGIWARGPGSDAVRGSLEQNAIFHILLQATPRLRQALCDKGDCDANGVPVTLPDPADFRAR